MNTLDSIIPIPKSVRHEAGTLKTEDIKYYSLPENCPKSIEDALKSFMYAVSAHWIPLEKDSEKGVLRLQLDSSLGAECWVCDVTHDGIVLCGGDRAGLRYALDSFAQMYLVATTDGPSRGLLNLGHIEDAPRFAWRGFLLDSSRHFQRAETIKNVLRLMPHFRMNKFHWHLIDSQGFRMPSKSLPKMGQYWDHVPGQYTVEEMKEIEDYAAELDIEIIPELDAPAHSNAFLRAYPEYACDPNNTGEEICIGNPKCMEMLKDLYKEILELLPRTRYIHIGGDEAETEHWEHCPVCQQAMKKLGITDIRQLEHKFMVSLMEEVKKLGCTPISWSIPSIQHATYPNEIPQDAYVQTWLDLREPIYWAKQGHKVIYSLHTSLYLDYPQNFSETHAPWMFILDEKGVYICEPYGLWGDLVKDSIQGVEAALWTETVPEWQIMSKLFSRLPAYAECNWSMPERKDWFDFSRRKENLEGVGYYELLRNY